VTHLYTLLTGGHVVRGNGQPDASAIAWAADTVLLVGADEEAAAISRGDSTAIDLGGAWVVGVATLEVGAPADFDVLATLDGAPEARSVIARIRGGRLVEGMLPGWHDHAPGDAHHP
jgi:hypothetical protein